MQGSRPQSPSDTSAEQWGEEDLGYQKNGAFIN